MIATKPTRPARPPRPPKSPPTVDEVIRRYVLARLTANGGNKVVTAAECGVAVKTIYNWLARWAGEVTLPGEQAHLTNGG